MTYASRVFKREASDTVYFLVLSCQRWTYLADINKQAQDRLQVVISQMKKAESVTEKMKEDNQWEWIQRMVSIHNRAEEIVLNELIYR